AADRELVLGALDLVVVASFDDAVGHEEAEPLETLRSGGAAREDDHEVAVARADELLASVDEPAAVAQRRGSREIADVGAGLGLGHRDRAAQLAARERGQVALL